MRYIKLNTTYDEEAYINIYKIVRIQQSEEGTQVDFDHPGLYAIVKETPEQILELIKRSTTQ